MADLLERTKMLKGCCLHARQQPEHSAYLDLWKLNLSRMEGAIALSRPGDKRRLMLS